MNYQTPYASQFPEGVITAVTLEPLFAVVHTTILDRRGGCTSWAGRTGRRTATNSTSRSVHLGHLGHHPDLKPRYIEICIEELQYASKHDPAVNGFLVGVLASFKVVDAASVIEQASAGGYVDLSISGN